MQDQLEQKLKDHIIYDKEKFGGIASDIKRHKRQPSISYRKRY